MEPLGPPPGPHGPPGFFREPRPPFENQGETHSGYGTCVMVLFWVAVSLSLGWPSAFPLVLVPYRDLIRFRSANFAHPLLYISPTIYHSDHI